MITNDNPLDDVSVPPTPEAAIAAPDFRAAGQALGDGWADSNAGTKKADYWQQWVIDTAAWLLSGLLKRFANILGFFAEILVKMREQLDEPLAKLASEGLSDLFGEELQSEAFAKIGDHAGRKDIAEIVGNQVLRGIVGDAPPTSVDGLTPSDTAAKAFITRFAELTVEGWFESIIAGLASEHPFEKVGDLKEQVSRTFSFGRISHRVLAPIIDAVVVSPFKHKVDKDYRPKLLSEATAVAMFNRNIFSREQLNEELARQGYADSRIDNLIAETQKSLSEGQVMTLWLTGYWTLEQVTQYMQQKGFHEDVVTQLIEHETQLYVLQERRQALAAARRAYVNRSIDVAEFTKYVNAAVAEPAIQHEILTQASAELELNRTYISEAKAEAAVVEGWWGLEQYTAHLQRLGYSDDDVLTMQLLVQEKIKETSDRTTARKAAAAARAAAKQARLDAATARQAALEQQRSHRDLTLAQVHRAYVQGRLTLGQLNDFLVQQKQAPDDINLLLTLAQAEAGDYQAAQAKKAHVAAKLAVTQLSLQQLEHLVKTGTLTLDDYQSVLSKEGVSDSDVALLVKAAQVDLNAAAAVKAHRDAVSAKLAQKGLSLSQFEVAVRHGLRTMADFRQWLAANNYTAADQASLTGLVQERIDADKVAADRKAAIAAKLAHRVISFAQLERAVVDGLRPISDYQQALIDSGVDIHDVNTLVGLLQRKADDAAALAKRKAEAATKAATKNISLPEIERAARLGLVSAAYYRGALSKAGMPAEDQDVLVRLLAADVERVQLARAKASAAAAKLQNRPVSLSVLQHSVKIGLKSIADYKLALAAEGFDAEAVDLMAELLQDEMAQAQVSASRKAALDAKRSVKEIARADFEKAVQDGLKTLDEYQAYLVEQGYDEEDQGILVDLLTKKLGL